MIQVDNCIINTLASSYYNWKCNCNLNKDNLFANKFQFTDPYYTKKCFSSNEFTDNAVNIYT